MECNVTLLVATRSQSGAFGALRGVRVRQRAVQHPLVACPMEACGTLGTFCNEDFLVERVQQLPFATQLADECLRLTQLHRQPTKGCMRTQLKGFTRTHLKGALREHT